jgi:SAM-dependent methyltransferase
LTFSTARLLVLLELIVIRKLVSFAKFIFVLVSSESNVSFRKGSKMDDKTEIDALASTNETDEYRFGYTHEEIERLRYQHQVWEKENQRFIFSAGFSKGATLVDLGCGPGYTTLDLAQVVGPGGKVIAIDRDGEHSLPLLSVQAEAAGLFNIETRAANLETFDLQEGSVDGVYGRWVLMYLSKATVKSLLGRMAKWLRPGGVCALTEFCNYRHIHIHPESKYLPEIAEALIQAVAGDRGCNPEIGNDLPGLLHSAGLDVEINVIVKAVRATTQEWLWPDSLFRSHLPALVKEGFLANSVFDDFLAEWEARSKEPGAIFFGSPMMAVVGRRS